MEGRPEFMQLSDRDSQGIKRQSTGIRPVRKIKVKALKGSPYVISLEKSDQVGEGSYGSVVRVFDLEHKDEELVAKVIPLNDKTKIAAMESELRVLIRLPLHPNLVNYKKIKVSSVDKQYFIMEYCNGGTLTRLLNQSSPISNKEILDFLVQFSRGYKVLYHSGIIHRDIKPENILIHNKQYKIADFGLAKIVDSLNIQNISAKGTPLYIAPELVRRQKSSAKVDMWSLGVILYRMLFEGRFPFLVSSIEYDVQTALRHIIDKPLIIPESPKRPEELVNLLKQMLEKDESKRISWERFFENPLIAPSLASKQTDIEEQQQQQQRAASKKSPYNPMKLYSSSSRVIQVDKTEEVEQINMADSLDFSDRYVQPVSIKELSKTADSTPKSSNSSSQYTKRFKQDSNQKENHSLYSNSSQRDDNLSTQGNTLSDEKPSSYRSAKERIAEGVRKIVKNSRRILHIKEGLERSEEAVDYHRQILTNNVNHEDGQAEEQHLSIREKALFYDRVVLRLMVMEGHLNQNKSLENILIQYIPMSQRAIILLVSAAQFEIAALLQTIAGQSNKQKNYSTPSKFHKHSFSISNLDTITNKSNHTTTNLYRQSSFINSHQSEAILTLPPLTFVLLQDQQWLRTLKDDFLEESGPAHFDKKGYAKRIEKLNIQEIARALTITVQALASLFEEIYKSAPQHSRGLVIMFTYLLQAKELCLSETPLKGLSHCNEYWSYYENIEMNGDVGCLYKDLVAQIEIEEHKKFQFLTDIRDSEYQRK